MNTPAANHAVSKQIPYCRNLSITPGAVTWTDSTGARHDLLAERVLSPGEAARALDRSTSWVLRRVRRGEIYPVLRANARSLEIFACALADYRARRLIT